MNENIALIKSTKLQKLTSGTYFYVSWLPLDEDRLVSTYRRTESYQSNMKSSRIWHSFSICIFQCFPYKFICISLCGNIWNSLISKATCMSTGNWIKISIKDFGEFFVLLKNLSIKLTKTFVKSAFIKWWFLLSMCFFSVYTAFWI